LLQTPFTYGIQSSYQKHAFSEHAAYTLCLKMNAPTLTNCSIDKHRLILIIFGTPYQPECLADTDLERCFLLKELDCFTSITHLFRRSYLKANKVNKSEGTKKVEQA